MRLWCVVVHVPVLGKERLLGVWAHFEDRATADNKAEGWRRDYSCTGARFDVVALYTPDIPLAAAADPELR